jgi:hypothetical protein
MWNRIDAHSAESIITAAISRIWTSPSNRIVCTRRVLRDAVATAIQEAYEIGFTAGTEADLREATRPGSADRPPWMDMRLDDKAAMSALQLRFWPIMIRSFHEAGYHCLGDLRWVPVEKLIRVFYIGRKTAKLVRAAIERLEREGQMSSPQDAGSEGAGV